MFSSHDIEVKVAIADVPIANGTEGFLGATIFNHLHQVIELVHRQGKIILPGAMGCTSD